MKSLINLFLIMLLFISCKEKEIVIKDKGINIRELSTAGHFFRSSTDLDTRYFYYAFAVANFSDTVPSHRQLLNTVVYGIIGEYKEMEPNSNISINMIFYRDTSLLEDRNMHHGNYSGMGYIRDNLNIIDIYDYSGGKLYKFSTENEKFERYSSSTMLEPFAKE